MRSTLPGHRCDRSSMAIGAVSDNGVEPVPPLIKNSHALTHVYDAMATHRVYKDAYSHDRQCQDVWRVNTLVSTLI